MVFCNLNHTVVFFRCQVHIVISGRIIMFTTNYHFIMQVRAGRFTGVTYFANHFAACHFLSDAFSVFAHMTVQCLESIAVIDHQTVPVALFPGGKSDDSIAGSIDFRCYLGREVHAGVETRSSVDRVDTYTVAGCRATQVLVGDWLDGRDAAAAFLLVLTQFNQLFQ